MRQKVVAGNWKLHGDRAFANGLLDAIVAADRPANVEIAILPPLPYISGLAERYAGKGLSFGAQDLGINEQGAYTGEVSVGMLVEFGCRYVIVGHSERRQFHAEGDQLVADKAKAALSRGVTPIVCVGETLAQREAGETESVVKRQLSAVIHTLGHCAGEMVVAYEPVWAIGTGRTATPEQAQAVHALLRAQLRAATPQADAMKILYGGSVKADNAATLFGQADIDGGLIGGASLKASDFVAICRAAG